MRFAILLGSFLLFQISYSFAQTDYKFASENAKWNYTEVSFLEGIYGTSASRNSVRYEVVRNTSIGNNQYQVIESSRNTAWSMILPAMIRRDTSGKVFIYDYDLLNERMIYDFSLVVGDTMKYIAHEYSNYWDDTFYYRVDSIDQIEIDTFRKRFFLSSIINLDALVDSLIIIEGVGSVNSHFLSPIYLESYTIPSNKFCLRSYENNLKYDVLEECYVVEYNNIENINGQYNQVNLYPNPSNNYINFSLESSQKTIESISILDLNGKEVIKSFETRIDVQSLASGMYFYSVDLGNNQFVRGRFLKE